MAHLEGLLEGLREAISGRAGGQLGSHGQLHPPLNEEAFCPDPCNNINSPLNSSFVVAGRVVLI